MGTICSRYEENGGYKYPKVPPTYEVRKLVCKEENIQKE